MDKLREAGQSYWQILPLSPTSYGDSPYQSFSSFAGNPYFIDLEALIEEGVLTEEECAACDFGDDPAKVSRCSSTALPESPPGKGLTRHSLLQEHSAAISCRDMCRWPVLCPEMLSVPVPADRPEPDRFPVGHGVLRLCLRFRAAAFRTGCVR